MYLDDYAVAGATGFTFHVESLDCDVARIRSLCEDVREKGMTCGIAISPQTSLDVIHHVVGDTAKARKAALARGAGLADAPTCICDLVLIMTVQPGFGGQSFMEDQMARVKDIRVTYGDALDIQVDGGVGPATIDACVEAGANLIVAGSSIYKTKDYATPIALLQASLDKRFS